jgi:hypothetical protein
MYICDLSNEDNLESNVEKLLQAATENGTQKLNHIAFTAGDSIPIQNVNDVMIPIIRKQEIVRFLGPVMIAKHLALRTWKSRLTIASPSPAV